MYAREARKIFPECFCEHVTDVNQSATVVTRGYESYRDCLKLAG